ncbi:MAG: LPS export ABC transporter permease LptF [Gammaproteobacteria bacterium GWE2_37_16]|nr:MAG: LPS export ABC transporter permease LptF [Gammaproteobacteria bacterium GWE2_37_16]
MIISRYLSKEIGSVLLGTTFLLFVIFLCNQLLSYMRAAAIGHLSLKAVLLLVSLQMPVLLTLLLPLSLFIGILLAYGRLYAESEMVVLFSCGVSIRALFRIVLTFAFFVMILVAVLSLWIAPKMEAYSTNIVAANKGEALDLLIPGRFSPVADGNWVFYVDEINKESKKMNWVFAAQKPERSAVAGAKKTWGVVFSQGGYQKYDEYGNKFIVLTNGNRYIGLPGRKDYQITKFGEYGVRLDSGQKNLHFGENALTTKTLWQGRFNPAYVAELNWRISFPIAVFILSLFAVPLSKVNPRYGRYFSLLPGVFCYALYFNLMFLGRVWLIKGSVPLWFGMWWVHVLMLMAALLIIFWKYRK